MHMNSSQSGHIRTSSVGYPSESTSPATSAAHLAPTRSGGSNNVLLPPPSHMHSPSAMNGTNTSLCASYDGKRLSKNSGQAAPELDLNGSASLTSHAIQSQRRGSGNLYNNNNGMKDAIVQTSASSPRPLTGQHSTTNTNVLHNMSRDGTVPNGVLLGSLAGYLPSPAVALANAPASAQQQNQNTPRVNSPHVSATARGGTGGDEKMSSATAQRDSRNSRQSITVINVTRDGPVRDDTRPPSNASMNMGGSVSDAHLGMGQAPPPRKASFNQISAVGRQQGPPPRVQREVIAAIPLSDASTSTDLSALQRRGLPSAGAYRHESPQQLQQRNHNADTPAGQLSSRASTVPPKQQSQRETCKSPVPPLVGNNHSASPHSQQQQPSQQREHHSSSSINNHSNGELALMTNPQHTARASPPNRAVSAAQYASSHGAVLHHRPSPATVAQHTDNSDQAIIPGGPATLQVSTTTLTKACKKVRYLLPSEAFDPDAPDPSDKAGLTAEEEEALLDPLNYTKAADSVAGRYPMLLRRPSSQSGDLPRGRRDSGSQLDRNGASHPTLLLDDGNRWARETNRPTVATTRDPSGATLTQLPSPSILQKGRATRNHGTTTTAAAPFPAFEKVRSGGRTQEGTGEEGASAGEYLLQRHVQQMATGKQLVEGTAFQPPSMTQRQRERRRREEEDNRREAATSHRNVPPSSRRGGGGPANVAEAGDVKPRRGPTDGLYEEIIRRANQNRRVALPTKVTLPLSTTTPAGAIMLPVAPPAAAAAMSAASSRSPVASPQQQQYPRVPAAPPHSGGRRRGRPHPNSAEPTPLHKESGVHHQPSSHDVHTLRDQQEQDQQYLPPRASSQPYVTSNYLEGTPVGSGASGTPHDKYYYPTPNTDADYYPPPPPPQQQQRRPPQPGRRPLPPPPPAASYHQPPLAPPPSQQQQQRPPLPRGHQPTAGRPFVSSKDSTPSTQRRTSNNSDPQNSPPPRQQPLQQQQQLLTLSAEATPDHSMTSTTPSIPGYTSGRFSKYNPPGLTPPPPHTALATRPEAADTKKDRMSRNTEEALVRQPAAAGTKTGPAPPQPPQPQQLQQQWEQPQEEEREGVPRTQHWLSPPAVAGAAAASSASPRTRQQPPQSLSSKQSSAIRRNPYPPFPATATSIDAPAEFYASLHDNVKDYVDDVNTYDNDDYAAAENSGDDGYYPTDDDDPVTDAANVRTPQQIITTVSNNNNTSSGSAGAEVRRSLLDQYNNGDDEGSQDTARGTQHAPPRQEQQRQQQMRQQHSNVPSNSLRGISHDRTNTPLSPPPPAAAAPLQDDYHKNDAGRELEQQQEGEPATVQEEVYEEAPSVSSFDTGTQPVTVSERGSDESNDDDDLVKKGPLLLKLGDDVYAPEGYVEEEDGEYYEEDEEDGSTTTR